MSGMQILLKKVSVVREPKLGRSIFGRRAERVISVKKRRLFDSFKNAVGIRFRKLRFMHPKMIHRAVFCATF